MCAQCGGLRAIPACHPRTSLLRIVSWSRCRERTATRPQDSALPRLSLGQHARRTARPSDSVVGCRPATCAWQTQSAFVPGVPFGALGSAPHPGDRWPRSACVWQTRWASVARSRSGGCRLRRRRGVPVVDVRAVPSTRGTSSAGEQNGLRSVPRAIGDARERHGSRYVPRLP